MARLVWDEYGLAFVRELLAQSMDPDVEVTAMSVGDAIELDERASANLMGWLSGHRLVCEADDMDQPYCDAYTTAPLALTVRGRVFADTGKVPLGQRLDWPTALDQLGKRL